MYIWHFFRFTIIKYNFFYFYTENLLIGANAWNGSYTPNITPSEHEVSGYYSNLPSGKSIYAVTSEYSKPLQALSISVLPDQCGADYHHYPNASHAYGHHHHHLNPTAVVSPAAAFVSSRSCGNVPTVGLLGAAAAVAVTPTVELELSYPSSAVANYHHQGWNYPYGTCPSTPGQTMQHQYVTVNQSQIHWHLHCGADRLDQYLGPSALSGIENGVSAVRGPSEIDVVTSNPLHHPRTSDANDGVMMTDDISLRTGDVSVPNDEMVDAEELHHHQHQQQQQQHQQQHQQQQHHQHQLHQQQHQQQQREHVNDPAILDPSSVWRPYNHGWWRPKSISIRCPTKPCA